jgi:hypothetical protein
VLSIHRCGCPAVQCISSLIHTQTRKRSVLSVMTSAALTAHRRTSCPALDAYQVIPVFMKMAYKESSSQHAPLLQDKFAQVYWTASIQVVRERYSDALPLFQVTWCCIQIC